MGPIPLFPRPNFSGNSFCFKYRLVGCPERRSGMPGSFSTVIAHMEPPSSRKQAKRVRLGPERPLLGPWRSSEGPGEADLIPTTPDWPAWVGFMVTTHFDLVSGPFHSPIFIGLHSVSTSANMYHLHTRAGELPRSASSHLIKMSNFEVPDRICLEFFLLPIVLYGV